MEFSKAIWQLLLNHFDQNSLKKSLLLSEFFRDLIITTPTLMRKLPVVWSDDLNRDKLEFIEKHGEHVRTVKFRHCGIEEIKKVLQMTPNIETIDYYTWNRIDDASSENIAATNPENIGTLKLASLSDLKIQSYSKFAVRLLKLLEQSTSLKSFAISVDNNEQLKSVGEFIMRQKELQKLEITEMYAKTKIVDTIFTESFLENNKMKLKSLTLVFNLSYNQKLSQFLLKQSENIEELALIDHTINFHYFRLLIDNFHNLKKLKISFCSLFNNKRTNEFKDIQIPSLTELEIVGYCDDIEAFVTLIDIFSNIEVLTMDVCYFSAKGMFEKLPRPRKLTTPSN
jgi:hypothetical protein